MLSPRLQTLVSAACCRQMATLVVCPDAASDPTPTLACITAAQQLADPSVDILCIESGSGRTPGINSVTDVAAKVAGVKSVFIARDEALQDGLAEPCAALVRDVMRRREYTACVMASSTAAKNILPRAAALLGRQPVTDVTAVLSATHFQRPIYAGNAVATVEFAAEPPLMLTIRPAAFAPAEASRREPAKVESIDAEDLAGAQEEYVTERSRRLATGEASTSARPDLGLAKVVVAGGRALKTKEDFAMLDGLADALGGAVGASRALVDAGIAPNELQIGQTGQVVAPDLYIAVGISGAVQHVSGIKDSKVIVAINTDEKAPIFSVADVGLVADVYEAVPQLTQSVRELKGS